MRDTKRSEIISTQLQQIAEQAIEYPDRVFTTLIHRMDVDFLREAYYRLRKDGAPGLSGVTAKDYGKDPEANLIDLHERLKGRSYSAPPIKRVWIDKEGCCFPRYSARPFPGTSGPGKTAFPGLLGIDLRKTARPGSGSGRESYGCSR